MSDSGSITIEDGRIPYAIVRSDRRTLAVCVSRDGEVLVRAPRRAPAAEIARLVQAKAAWVVRKRDEMVQRRPAGPMPELGRAELAAARVLLGERLAACWSVFAGDVEAVPPLRIRAMRSRWGSLSPEGRVCLNAWLVRAPVECIDYVVFHELCHLRVRGHSRDFYAEVARYVPDWRECRRRLRAIHL